MQGVYILASILGLVIADNGPLIQCERDLMFVADKEDLCRYHWCMSDGSTVAMRCPPGNRLPTWWMSSADNPEIPCSLDRREEITCLRCNIASDPRGPVERRTFFCDSEPCVNNGICHSQWDDYWCECPNGFTGKNCDVNFCEPNPCKNGGTCAADRTNYHCECLSGFSSACCDREGDQCETCMWGDNCELIQSWRCECALCPSQTDVCIPGVEFESDRVCAGRQLDSGSQYTVTFGNASTCDGAKHVYISVADSPSQERNVRLFSPNLPVSNPCYINLVVQVTANLPYHLDVGNGCYETLQASATSGAILKIEELNGLSLVVTASTCSSDGYLAIPDYMAGTYYLTSTFGDSNDGEYITVVALADGTEITINEPSPADSGSSQAPGTTRVVLNRFESFRFSAEDLSEAWLVSSAPVHVWSGSVGGTVQETREQNVAVSQWGERGDHIYFIGSPSSSIATYGEVTMQTAIATSYSLYRVRSDGTREILRSGTVGPNSWIDLGSMVDDEIWVLETSEPAQVNHNIFGRSAEGEPVISTAYTRIPPAANYAQAYSFQLHGDDFDEYTEHRVVIYALTSRRGDLFIYRMTSSGQQFIYRVEELEGVWLPSHKGYSWTSMIMPGEGWYYISTSTISSSYSFGAIYYALNEDSLTPNSALPLGYGSQVNTIIEDRVCATCLMGPDCTLELNLCLCNPCPNPSDKCSDSPSSIERICMSVPDTTGTLFSFVFMQNRPNDDKHRELEVYITLTEEGSELVHIYTPYLQSDGDCYFSNITTVQSHTVTRFVVNNPECAEQKNSLIYRDKMIRVESLNGQALVVYAVNRDTWSADGWLAYPDTSASTQFRVLAFAPAQYHTQFAVLALQNGTKVTLSYTGLAVPNLLGNEFVLQAGESMQVQSRGDLTGTLIESDKPVHAFSGNVRALVTQVLDPDRPRLTSRSRDHLIEQLIPYSAWGFEYNVQPIPDRIFGDHLKVMAGDSNTTVIIQDRTPDGVESDRSVTLQAGQFEIFDAYSSNAYRVTADKKIMVAQVTKSKDRKESAHDPSMIYVPPVQQYSNQYMFSTPEFSGGDQGAERPYNTTMVLLSALRSDIDNIILSTYGQVSAVDGNGQDNTPNFVTRPILVSNLTEFGDWVKVPGSNYYNKAVRIPFGTNIVSHPDRTVEFMCIFYGMDDRESLGFPAGMKLRELADPQRHSD